MLDNSFSYSVKEEADGRPLLVSPPQAATVAILPSGVTGLGGA